jgi:hypothetical protein
LRISVQDADATLIWPSKEGETFVVQYRHTLDPSDSWQTLAPAWPAAAGTNVTSYVHYGIVQYPPAGSGGGTNGGNVSPFPFNSMAMSAPMPLAIPANGTGAAVPLALYPPGMDLSGFTIFDPVTRESVSGNGYTVKPADKTPNGDMQPMDVSDDDTNQYTGFYRVLGVHLVSGLTNDMTASDYINIQTRPEYEAQYLRLIANGQTYPMQDLLLPPFTNSDSVTFQYVDTARLANGGPYTLQVEGIWQDSETSLRDDGLLKADSQPFTIYVTNELSYPDWDDYVNDDSASFYVQSLHPDVDWEIDIYNYYDYLYWYYGYTDIITPIHIATGNTTNGLIEYHWNLMDDNGILHTNEDDDPYFVSFTYTSWSGDGGLDGGVFHANGVHPNAGGGSAQKANPLQQQSAAWPSDGGYWIVAYQDMFRHYYDAGDLMHAMLNGWLGMAAEVNPVFYQTPTGGTNAQTFPMRYQYPQGHRLFDPNFSYQGKIYDNHLLHLMIHDPRARNFYYFGHGSSEWFGGSIYAALEKQYKTHRYRFVWLDGCETANGDWDKVFNINGPGIFGLDYYKERSKRPAVFMGHTQTIPLGIFGQRVVNGTTYDGTIPDSVPYFRTQFIFYWQLEGYKLNQALDAARNSIPEENMHYEDGPLDGQHYAPGDALQIEGYDELRRNEYNAAGDIPRP